MEQYGNEHFNFERVLRENIHGHEYMRRTAREMNTWEEVVDEIYRAVDHVEPWMSGNVRGPSTAFCLLYRLCELKLTEEQIQETITCKDSPFIRAVGFLYLRYVCMPAHLREWLQPYLQDSQKFYPSGETYGKLITMGQYVCDLILSQTYFETILSRLPKKYQDELISDMKDAGLSAEPIGNAGQGGPERRAGDDGRGRPQSVKASLSVAMGQRAPNRAGVVEDASQRAQRREDAPGASDRSKGDRHHDRGDSRERERPREAVPRFDGRDRRPEPRGGYASGARRPSPSVRGDGRDSRDDRRADRDRDRYGGRHGDRDWRGGRGRPDHGRNGFGRPASDVFGRSAADVFGKASADHMPVSLAVDDDPALASASDDGAVRIGRRRR